MKVIALITASFLLAIVLAAPSNNKQETTQITYRNLYKNPAKNPPDIPSSGRIIHGHIAEPHSIPYQAFLEINDGKTSAWYCGGSLISTKTVLTAGHCGYQGAEAIITLGAHERLKNEPTQIMMKSNDIVIHEDFNMQLILNDIALIRLKYPVQLTDAIQTIPLYPNYDYLFVGEVGRVSGWGLTDGNSNQLSSQLRYTENAILSNEQCEMWFYGNYIPHTQVCMSGFEGRGSCNGDSGGPLTVGSYQIGIVSYGVSGCLPEYPSVFTRTNKFNKWIVDNSA